MKRRNFLQGLAAGAGTFGAPLFLKREILAAPGRPGAGDRIVVGLIGPGDRAHSLLSDAPFDLKLVALADCDLRQMEEYEKWVVQKRPGLVGGPLARYQDYRQMFDRENLDAVVVATTTHSRALICLHAMQAGLDVYAEKPLTLTIEEGQYLARAERRFKTVFQVGTQQRSLPLNNFGGDLVKNGAIGKVHTVLCSNFVGPLPRPELMSERVPDGLNWDMWCHQTDLIPFSSQLHPKLGKWGPWRPYDGAGQSFGVTGWGTHAFDQVQRALGTDHTTPSEIWLEEDPSPKAKVSLRYADGPVLKLTLGPDEGPGLGGIFLGEKGKIEINRNRVVSDPPELVKDAPEPDDPSVTASVTQRHLQNWIDCMRSRQTPNASAEVARRSTDICHIINICRELGRPLKWDPDAETFVGDEEANLLRSRPRREGYELPEIT